METKVCSKCGIEKKAREFHKDKRAKNGLKSQCKKCSKTYQKKYHKNNCEKIKESNKKWREKYPGYQKIWCGNNKEKAKKYREKYCSNNPEKIKKSNKKWRENNKEKAKGLRQAWCENNRERINKYSKEWRENNKQYYNKYYRDKRRTSAKWKIRNIMSCGIYQSLKGSKDGHHWEDLIGYSVDDLIKRLKKTLPPGYKWQDYIAGETDLQIDHITPISVFNFKSYNDTDFHRCWALTNLQLLPAEENLTKSNKLEKPFQPSLTGF